MASKLVFYAQSTIMLISGRLARWQIVVKKAKATKPEQRPKHLSRLLQIYKRSVWRNNKKTKTKEREKKKKKKRGL